MRDLKANEVAAVAGGMIVSGPVDPLMPHMPPLDGGPIQLPGYPDPMPQPIDPLPSVPVDPV